MDGLRGHFDSLGGTSHDDVNEEDIMDEAPPPEIGKDERRMQVRAYNFWASLLDNRNYPNVEDLDPDTLPDFGPNGVMLDFSKGTEDPAVAFMGDRLAEECGANGMEIDRLSDVPSRSLLSRITDHYMQILANQAPIGFEAEFVNQRGATILYRGILLPFSSDNDTIDFIFGVINWKELAEQKTADELLLEIDQALEDGAARYAKRTNDAPMADWADGPGSIGVDALAGTASNDDLPRPSFGLDAAADALVTSAAEPLELTDIDPSSMALADWLALAREMAAAARRSQDRTRNALYDAISRAYDFALAAKGEPADFTCLVEDAGLSVQERAPMTPVVKLVFGVDYDKTRLTEYAAALSHAQRMGLGYGQLSGFLRAADGGLKGVVQAERAFRREEAGKPAPQTPNGPRKAIANRLRAMEAHDFAALDQSGDEFGLVMIRRTQTGDIVMLGEVPGDVAMVEKAARQLLG